MKALAYLRVSTKEQASDSAFGLEAQKEIIESWEKQTGNTIPKFYIDKGYSGSTQDRPKLLTMLKDIKHLPDIEAVVVPKFDRWARDTFLHLYLEKELKVQGVELLSATEDSMNSDDPTTRFQRTLMSAMAEYEREMIRIRMEGGRRQKAKKGGHATGRIPYGYRKGEDGLEIHPEEANGVQLIYEMRNAGNSLRTIANKLNKKGYATKKGNKFRAKTVSRILKNPKYKGIMNQTVAGEQVDSENGSLRIYNGV